MFKGMTDAISRRDGSAVRAGGPLSRRQTSLRRGHHRHRPRLLRALTVPRPSLDAMTTLSDRPNTALLVVDVQNGVVGGSHNRDEVVSNIVSLVDRARAADVPIVWVQHNSDELPK